jgi:hypothetical protein
VAGPVLAAEQEDPEVAPVVVPAAAEPAVVVEAVIGNHVIPLQTFLLFSNLFSSRRTLIQEFS